MKRQNILYIKLSEGDRFPFAWEWEIKNASTGKAIDECQVPYVTKKSAIRGALRALNLWDGRTTGPWNTVLGRKNYVVYTQIVE